MSRFLNLSQIYEMILAKTGQESLKLLQEWFSRQELPIGYAAGALLTDAGLVDMSREVPSLVNVAASFWTWWGGKRRIIYRITPESAAQIRPVGIAFVPEATPESWSNGALVLESSDNRQPLFSNVVGVAAYRAQATTGEDRYFVVTIHTPDGMAVYSIRTDLARLNERLAKDGRLLDNAFLIEAGIEEPESRERQLKALEAYRFLFVASYYLAGGRLVTASENGKPARDPLTGKVQKRKGQPVYVWQYAKLNLRESERGDSLPRGELNKTGLDLVPTVVGIHIRRYGDKVVVIEPYDSHRWRRPTILGTKVTL